MRRHTGNGSDKGREVLHIICPFLERVLNSKQSGDETEGFLTIICLNAQPDNGPPRGRINVAHDSHLLVPLRDALLVDANCVDQEDAALILVPEAFQGSSKIGGDGDGDAIADDLARKRNIAPAIGKAFIFLGTVPVQ